MLGVSYDQIIGYAQSPEHAAAISAVTSALGVALAALGPLAYGFGLEATASATSSLIGLGGVVVFQLVLGLNTGQLVARRSLQHDAASKTILTIPQGFLVKHCSGR